MLNLKLIFFCQISIFINAFFVISKVNVRSFENFSETIRNDLFFYSFFNIPIESLHWLQIIFFLFMIFYILGIYPQISSVICFAISFFVLGYRYNFSFYHWADSIIPLSLLGSCLFPINLRGINTTPPNKRYIWWHITTFRVILILIFFSAGISKIQNSGFNWGQAENHRHLINLNLFLFSEWLSSFNYIIKDFLLSSTLLLFLTGYFVLLLELLSPLALVHFKFRYFIYSLLFLLTIMFSLVYSHHFVIYLWPLFLYGAQFTKKELGQNGSLSP